MLDVTQIQEIIPHRFPFLLVDRVVDLVKNESIHAYKNVTIGEPVFQGHFPNHPIYPGVMIIEGMAQAGGVLAFMSAKEQGIDIAQKVVYFMSVDGCKFRNPVRPGDRLDYKIEVAKVRGTMWVLNARAFVEDKLCAEAELKAMIVDK